MAEIIVEPIEEYGLSSESKPKQLFSKVGIVGCGSVGRNIALMISKKEVDVVFIELSEELVQDALQKIDQELDYAIDHWGLTHGDKRAILSRINGYVGYENLAGCDLVIESIRLKTRQRLINSRREVFVSAERVVSPGCIITTNSTMIIITELASALEHKERCLSLNFLTSNPNSEIVEIVRSNYTTDEVYNKMVKFIEMLDKVAVPVEESAGLISMRVFVAQLNEACDVLQEGVGTMNDIDLTMRLGWGQSLGPFELADKIGLDKVLRWTDNLYEEFGDTKYKARPILKRLVRAGRIGRVTFSGFYKYNDDGKRIS